MSSATRVAHMTQQVTGGSAGLMVSEHGNAITGTDVTMVAAARSARVRARASVHPMP